MGDGGAARGVRPVTRNDVARAAGVSPALVSLVLNDRPGVRPDKRARVLQAAAQLGYEPNLAARALKTRHTGLVAYLADDLANPFFPDLALGMEEEARARGWALVLCHTGDVAVQAIVRQRVDGVLAGWMEPAHEEMVRGHGIALVRLSVQPPEAGVGWVDVDWGQGLAEALDHLVALGHTELALIAGNVEEPRSAHYREHCRRHGLPAERIVYGDWRLDGGYAAMVRLLAQGGCTAVIAANDIMALGALAACRDAGLRVPDDLSLIGCDDIPLAAVSAPALTTIRYPRRAVARAAVSLLAETMAGAAPRGVLIPTRLVLRRSTAPPRRSAPGGP